MSTEKQPFAVSVWTLAVLTIFRCRPLLPIHSKSFAVFKEMPLRKVVVIIFRVD